METSGAIRPAHLHPFRVDLDAVNRDSGSPGGGGGKSVGQSQLPVLSPLLLISWVDSGNFTKV